VELRTNIRKTQTKEVYNIAVQLSTAQFDGGEHEAQQTFKD